MSVINGHLNFALACIMFAGWVMLLDSAEIFMQNYADRKEDFVRSVPKAQKWMRITKEQGSFKDEEIDNIYSTPGGVHSSNPRSAARALADIVGIYVLLGKVVGLALLVLFFIGIDIKQNIVWIFISFGAGICLTAMNVNSAVASLVPIVLSNAVHVGELISLGHPGGGPSNSPGHAVVGNVEAITWGHVVIRDFDRQQVFIPNSGFNGLSITNWSRRPGKMCSFSIAVSPGDKAFHLGNLSKFVNQWIKAHPEIDHDNYIKCKIGLKSNGAQGLTVMFYPKLGSKKYEQICAEFLVMITTATQRLGLTLMDVNSGYPFPPANESKSDEIDLQGDLGETLSTEKLNDLMPSEKLTMMAGYNPKPKYA